MNINIGSKSLDGFQTTDGGYKYRRVQTVAVGTSTQTGLLEVESKFSTDAKGIGRLLVRCDMPYYTVNTATSCCCDEGEKTPTYVQSGKITFHTVLTLPKQAIADIKSANGVLAANQIASIVGMTLGMSNTMASPTEASMGVGDGLAMFTGSGTLQIDVGTDHWKILDPKRAIIRGVMGVTPMPPEGFGATTEINTMRQDAV